MTTDSKPQNRDWRGIGAIYNAESRLKMGLSTEQRSNVIGLVHKNARSRDEELDFLKLLGVLPSK